MGRRKFCDALNVVSIKLYIVGRNHASQNLVICEVALVLIKLKSAKDKRSPDGVTHRIIMAKVPQCCPGSTTKVST